MLHCSKTLPTVYYAQIMLIDIEQFSDIYSSILVFCR